jgi:hypothetical protein
MKRSSRVLHVVVVLLLLLLLLLLLCPCLTQLSAA